MKIDTSKIDGYAEMTAEDKLKALEEYEIETPKDNSEEINKLKASLSKANSDAAEWKRQFREKQSEQERAEAERAEREKAVEDELRTLRRDKTVSGYLAQCLALGYDKELALKAAEAMADNDAANLGYLDIAVSVGVVLDGGSHIGRVVQIQRALRRRAVGGDGEMQRRPSAVLFLLGLQRNGRHEQQQ